MYALNRIYEDDDIILINKEAGLAVQGGEKVSVCLIDLLAKEYAVRPFLVHRLDKDTSGLILVAKSQAMASRYSKLLATDQVKKVYCAVCQGRVEKPRGTISEAISVRGEEKSAVTHFERLASDDDCSLLELELGTGRMHQIRIHLASIGHPILGDDKYGDFPLNKRLKKERALKRLLLHARRLTLPLPSGDVREFVAPFPDYFTPWLEQLAFE